MGMVKGREEVRSSIMKKLTALLKIIVILIEHLGFARHGLSTLPVRAHQKPHGGIPVFISYTCCDKPPQT